MGYYIYARLENGNPQLQIVDSESKLLCMSWCYNSNDTNQNNDKKEVQRLFRELLLLTCRQAKGNCRVFTEKSIINEVGSSLLYDCLREVDVEYK